jgi:hypothetical protein
MATTLDQEIGHGITGLIPWSAFSDVSEPVAELAWPNSIATYSSMRTDAQIASLFLAFTLPISRYDWCIDPNGARDEAVDHVANDLDLPVEGQQPKPTGRRRDRFSHDWHLFAALNMIVWAACTSSRYTASTMRPSVTGCASWHLACRGPSRRSRSLVMVVSDTWKSAAPPCHAAMRHQPRPTLGQCSADLWIASRSLLVGFEHPVPRVPPLVRPLVPKNQQSKWVACSASVSCFDRLDVTGLIVPAGWAGLQVVRAVGLLGFGPKSWRLQRADAWPRRLLGGSGRVW